jgi:hypothetical protein
MMQELWAKRNSSPGELLVCDGCLSCGALQRARWRISGLSYPQTCAWSRHLHLTSGFCAMLHQ